MMNFMADRLNEPLWAYWSAALLMPDMSLESFPTFKELIRGPRAVVLYTTVYGLVLLSGNLLDRSFAPLAHQGFHSPSQVTLLQDRFSFHNVNASIHQHQQS